MKRFFKKNWFFLLLGVFLLINIILVTYNFVLFRQRKNENRKFIQERKSFESRQIKQNIRSDFYNLPCPEITIYSTAGENINLRNLAGNVIIIRFSQFYRQDLPNLVYLQHIADKYRNQGVSLIFINSLGKHDKDAINKIVNLSSPIVENDGSITALFNALPEDVIIIDRDFTIKFKYHRASKTLIFNEVMKWAFADQTKPIYTQGAALERLIQKLAFYDVINRKRIRVDQLQEKNILLTLFASACTGCEENTRILLLKEIAKNIDQDKVHILILFGKGNNINAIRQYAALNEWNEFPFIVGVIEDSEDLPQKKYYQIFQLDTDPRTFIINSEGKLIFAETLKTTKVINLDYLKKLTK